jgi:hypothetical protein
MFFCILPIYLGFTGRSSGPQSWGAPGLFDHRFYHIRSTLDDRGASRDTEADCAAGH